MDEQKDHGVLIGRPAGSRIVLHPPKRLSRDGFDHVVDIFAGSFQGSIKASCSANLYPDSLAVLRDLYNTLSGSLAMCRAYENLTVDFKGDRRGHFLIEITAADYRKDARLSFSTWMEQTELPSLIKALERTFVSGS